MHTTRRNDSRLRSVPSLCDLGIRYIICHTELSQPHISDDTACRPRSCPNSCPLPVPLQFASRGWVTAHIAAMNYSCTIQQIIALNCSGCRFGRNAMQRSIAHVRTNDDNVSFVAGQDRRGGKEQKRPRPSHRRISITDVVTDITFWQERWHNSIDDKVLIYRLGLLED
jgi:hypothetical protein